VAKPLTLISTWDGDEISIRRTYRHLVVARNLLRDKTAAQFEKAVREAISLPITGQGLWLAIQFGERDRLLERAGQQGLILTAGYHNRALLCPPVNLSERDIHDGVAILKRVIDELS
jgi:acetylornithine/succinyldiaminopimelate/putrescine aminotransferase